MLYEREEHTLFVPNVPFQNRAELVQEADGPLPRLYIDSPAPDRHVVRQDSHDRFLLGACDSFGTAKPLGNEQRLVVVPGELTQCLSALHGGIWRLLPVGCISRK